MAARQNRILQAGARAPEFGLEHQEGAILLVFFKVTCPVCQFTLPFLNRIHSAGTLPVYGISQDDDADTREFNQEFGIQFPVLLDREEAGYPVSNEYGISSVPSLFLVEPDGRIARVIEGWSKREMEWLGARANATVIRQNDTVPEWKAG